MTNGDTQQPSPDDEPDSRDTKASAELPTQFTDTGHLQETLSAELIGTQADKLTRVGRLPEHFGRYKILKILGEGGMGAVYLAEDTQLDRRVAIKIPFVGMSDSSTVLDRFYREAKALAAIVHPNICPIHEVGEVFGVHFIAMTYVEGKSLSEYIRSDKPQPIKQSLVLVHKLASALHHAHAAGVIHRDLKPANIIINRLKEPVIMDFGLARREGKSDAVVTQAGQIMGTPAYMPPEQFAGDVEAMGPGCDIYSLGVILYELLTTQRPFTGDLMAIMAKIARDDPPPPSQHRAEIDSQLDAICLRALAKRPQDRFASMEEFTAAITGCLKARIKAPSSGKTTRAVSRGGTIQAGQAADETTGLVSATSAPVSPQPHHAEPPSTLAATSSAPLDPTAGSNEVIAAGQGYQLIKQLGTGQYGEVWLGMAPGGIEVAIKKLLFPVGHKATQVELQALELMKRLRHSFLMQVQAYWVMEEQLLIVMELADGSLEDRHAECRRETGQGIPRAELFGYIREAAEAIDFLHQEQVLHRDIKPGNILLVKGHVKVADFGIATSGVMSSDQLTTTSATLGTPLYMGPELWNKQAGPRSDQYSLAVTYVELRLGSELVFDEHNRLVLSMLPENEQVVLSKALAPNPRDRYETCRQFSQSLDDIVEGEYRAVEEQRQRELRKIEEKQRQELRAAEDRRRRTRLQLVVGALILACLPVAWYIWKNPLWQTVAPGLSAQETFTLNAGAESRELAVTKVGEWGDEAFGPIVLEGIPDGIEVIEQRANERGIDVILKADLQCDSASIPVTLVATAHGERIQCLLTLQIEAAKCVLPKTWNSQDWEVPSNAVKREVGGKFYYDRIERITPDGSRAELLLIPQTRSSDPGTFYCMKNKVSNRLFAAFVQEEPGEISAESEWLRGARAGSEWKAAMDHLDHPVFSVSVAEAHAFATWFGGLLPKVDQWDKAAGRWDHDDAAQGPYLTSWDATADVGQIAVNGLLGGPLPVGVAEKDISPYGCRDMAGNGREWTRNLYEVGRTVPVADPSGLDEVIIRGSAYVRDQPLRYRDLEDEDLMGTEYYRFSDSAADVSFRCVVELPVD